MSNFSGLAKLIWDNAELLRGDYRRHENGKVILPFTVLRRLDCALEESKKDVLAELPKLDGLPEKTQEYHLNRLTKLTFHNVSPFDFKRLLNDPAQLAPNLTAYINGFSQNIRKVFEYFAFAEQIKRLDGPGEQSLLYLIVKKFGEFDLHPRRIDNHMMGTVFEELIRFANEQSNETAGEHFTPREVIRLMVNLLFNEGRDTLRKEGIVRTLYDPAGGTGGMLSIAEEYLAELNPHARLEVFGQELNPESYAVCRSDMILKGQNVYNIKFGNSFTSDGLQGKTFDYMLSNPPFGVEWKKVEKAIKDEHEGMGTAGRFGAGLPRISDGSLLFLQHMLSKRKEEDDATRIAIVFNGSPLFTGGAGSGESEIRRWIIENDWQVSDEVALEYYRLQKMREGSLVLEKGNGVLSVASEVGTGQNEAEEEALSEIIKVLNAHFGTEFTDSDQLFFEQIEWDMSNDPDLALQAQNNSLENFKYPFDTIFIDRVIERMEQNQEITDRIMEEEGFSNAVKEFLLARVYHRLRRSKPR